MLRFLSTHAPRSLLYASKLLRTTPATRIVSMVYFQTSVNELKSVR
jgi:hypothetical protein